MGDPNINQYPSEYMQKKKSPPRKISKAQLAIMLAEGYRFLYKIYSKNGKPIALGIYGDFIEDPVILCNSQEDVDYRFDALLEGYQYIKGGDDDHRKELYRKAIQKRKKHGDN